MDSELIAFERIKTAARPGARLSDLAGIFDGTLQETWVAIGATDYTF